jgi:peroxiredoxin
MKFTAVDGQKVDLAQMRGKVVLVDFWETGCGGCIKEMPFVKAAYDKFHAQGLEIIGISGDTDKDKLNRFVKEKNLPWPEWMDNKIAPDFGVDTLPQIFLLDKRGVLRFYNVKANDKPHRPGDTTTFESKITSLLTEP